MLDSELEVLATGILSDLPAALEMPAGTGKTQLVAAMAAVAGRASRPTLILTHTHAGVDAIRRRLRCLDVPPAATHIDTITGWAFDLVRSYPHLAGLTVPAVPNWNDSLAYIAGAARVARATAIADMHAASFGHLIVDEYQDCNRPQHDLVTAIADAVPRACVLGDRLQGIFGFRGESLVDWESDVFARFPLHELSYQASDLRKLVCGPCSMLITVW